MKGISTVLAIVLIVVITVAIIGLAYGWATGIFSMAESASEDQVSSVVDTLGKSVNIVSSACVAYEEAFNVSFTIKNTGTADINAEELSVFLGGLKKTTTPNITALSEGAISDPYTILDVAIGEYVLKIDAPAYSVEEPIICE